MTTGEQVSIETYKPEPAQIKFHTAPQRNKLYGGAMGGGKTRTLCEEVNRLMIDYPGNRGLLLRKTFADLRISTYLQLTEKVLSSLIIQGLVKENKERKTFTYWNGSVLFYGGLDATAKDKEKYFSAEFGVIAIDEAREITEDEFKKLGTRLRHKLPDGTFPPFYMLLGSNPSQNWLKQRFILNAIEGYVFIPALPRDNPHNPDDYEDQLRDLFHGDEKFIQAYIEGSWDAVGSIDDLLLMSDVNPCIDFPVFPETGMQEKRVTACDPARFGDDTTQIYDFVNYGVVDSESYGQKETMETVGRLQWHREKNRSNLIALDTIFAPGIYDRLVELSQQGRAPQHQFGVMSVDFRETANVPDKFRNRRAEVYWFARGLIKNRLCSIPNDSQLHGQLCSIKYKFIGGSTGTKIQIEPKDDIKARLGVSPDKADAFVMGLWAVKHASPVITDIYALDTADSWEDDRRRQLREYANA